MKNFEMKTYDQISLITNDDNLPVGFCKNLMANRRPAFNLPNDGPLHCRAWAALSLDMLANEIVYP